MGEVCLDDEKIGRMGFRTRPNHQDQAIGCQQGERPFRRWCNLGMIATNLKVIWEMSVNSQEETNGS